MILIFISVLIFTVPLLFQQNEYIPYYDFASLLCTQLWIFEANKSIAFSHLLFLTTIIMFAQGFVLSILFLQEDAITDFSNVYVAFIYFILTLIFANPLIIKIQDKLAQRFEVYPYSIMVIDRVNQALTILRYFENIFIQKQQQLSFVSFLSTGFLSQISIIVLVLGLRESYSLSQALSKVKELALENFIIYTIAQIVFCYMFQINIFRENLEYLNVLTIFLFVLLTTVFYVSKKNINIKIIEKEKIY